MRVNKEDPNHHPVIHVRMLCNSMRNYMWHEYVGLNWCVCVLYIYIFFFGIFDRVSEFFLTHILFPSVVDGSKLATPKTKMDGFKLKSTNLLDLPSLSHLHPSDFSNELHSRPKSRAALDCLEKSRSQNSVEKYDAPRLTNLYDQSMAHSSETFMDSKLWLGSYKWAYDEVRKPQYHWLVCLRKIYTVYIYIYV